MKAKTRVLSLALSVVMLVAMCLCVPVDLTAQASAGITSVVFDYTDGESDVWTGKSSAAQTKTENVAVSGDTVTAVSNSGILNLTAWENGGKKYSVGSEIPVSDLVSDGTTAVMTPVFGAYTEDFSNLSAADAKWWSGKTLGTGEAVAANDGDAQGSYVKFTTNSDFRGVALTDEDGKYINFNKGATYKVSLKYKSTGATNIQIYFGAPVKNTDGSSGSGYIQRNTVKAVSGAVSDWTEATVYVTAPDTYKSEKYHAGTHTDYSRVVGIGYTKNTSGATLCIDDVSVTPFDVVFESTVSDIDDIYMSFDEDGNITLPEAKANYNSVSVESGILNLVWKNGGKYYKPGETVNKADLIADGLTYNFTTHFGAAEVTYNKLTDTADGASTNAFYTAARYYGTGNFVTSENDEIGETDTSGLKIKSHECIDLAKDASVNTFRNALFVQTGGTASQNTFNPAVDKSVHFEPGKQYQVTFRYRSYIPADFYVAFGIPADSTCGSGGEHVLLAQTEASNESTATGLWETKTVTVTAPTEVLTTRMGISVKIATTTTGHNQLRIDDITVVPVEDLITVNYDFGYKTVKQESVAKTKALSFPTDANVVNLTGWSFNGKTYSLNDTVVPMDISASEEITLTAVYGAATFDFEESTVGDGSTYTGTGAFSIAGDDTNKTLKINANTSAHRRFALTNNDRAKEFATYNKGQAYKVTFNYSSEIKDGYYGEITLAYGQSALNNNCWGNSKASIAYKVVEKVSASVSNKTATAIVTAPDTYSFGCFCGAASHKADAGYFSIGILSNTSAQGNVIIYVDNITITPVSNAKVSAYALFANSSSDTVLSDTSGNVMQPESVVYKNKSGSERSAFRFISAFDYYTDGTDLYLDEAKTVKILKRGMNFGIYDGASYNYKTKSEVVANAAAWNDNGSTLEYSFKVYNISVANKDVVYYATPYLIVEVDGAQQTIEGETQATSVQGIYDTSEAKVNGYGWYPEMTVNSTDFMHISFDDVSTSFTNLTNNTYTSLYDEPFFGWLKGLNDTYGAKFSLYAYANSLADVPATYATEFAAASDWLKIGLHADNSSSNFGGYTEAQGKASWEAFVEDVTRITGTTDSIDTMPRLHTFAGSEAALKGMANASVKPATGFLSADDSRTSYYFTSEVRDYLYDNDHVTDNVNDLVFLSTDLRGDWFASDFTSANTYKKPVKDNVYDELVYRFTDNSFAASRSSYIFFTHEWQGSRATWVEDAVRFASENNLRFAFPMNETFSATDYDINEEATPTVPTTTTRDGNTVTIVDDIADMQYVAGHSFNGGSELVSQTNTVGRAASIYYVLRVNGGETLSLTQAVTDVTVNYAFKEFTDVPLVKENITSGGQVCGQWISGSMTLQSSTKYIIIAFKKGDGSTDFTAAELEQLSSCLTLS